MRNGDDSQQSVDTTKNKATVQRQFRITFYAGDGITANGTKPIPLTTCATGYGIPIGTKINVPSIGILTVTDRGNPSVVTDNVLDVFVSGTEAETMDMGVRYENCTILN